MGVVNGHVMSLPLNFSFPHNMTCDKLVTNWFIGYSDRNIMEYRRLFLKDLVHVEREHHTLQTMKWFIKVVERYAPTEMFWK